MSDRNDNASSPSQLQDMLSNALQRAVATLSTVILDRNKLIELKDRSERALIVQVIFSM